MVKIGIAGIGGIGSNVARYLVQAGVPALKLVDFDRVEESNLDRQFYFLDQVGRKKPRSLCENLARICPRTRLEPVDTRIGPGNASALFSDCAVVVEGLDGKSDKKMLVEALAGTGIVMVGASGIAGPDMDRVETRALGHCLLVGDFTSDQAEHDLYPPKIGLITALMAGLVLENAVLAGRDSRNNSEGRPL